MGIFRYALGDLSVTLFFVLSGASLALSSVQNINAFNFVEFYIKRFFRIYPLYAIALITYFVFRFIYHEYIRLGLVTTDIWLTGQFVQPITSMVWFSHLTMTFNLLDIPNNFNNVLWSLPIEMQFYLFFPLFMLFLRRGKWTGSLLIVIVCLITYFIGLFLHIHGATLQRLWEFAGGILLIVHIRIVDILTSSRSKMLILLGFVIILFLLGRNVSIHLFPSNFFNVLFCFSVVMLAFALRKWRVQHKWQHFMVNLGIWSYSLYVFHNLVLGLVSPLITLLSLSQISYFWVTTVVVFVIIVPCSWFLFSYVETPFIRWGNRLIRR